MVTAVHFRSLAHEDIMNLFMIEADKQVHKRDQNGCITIPKLNKIYSHNLHLTKYNVTGPPMR
jgi:hypothetical protein